MKLKKYTSEFGYNWKLAAPVMLGMLGHTFVGFVDNVMVGQLGTAELAAVSLGNSFVFIALSLAIGFSTAITSLIAEADAANNQAQAKSVFKHGFFLCFSLGILMFLAVYFFKPILYAMNQPIEVINLAMPYLDLVAVSLVPMVVFQALKQFSDGLSMTKVPMYASLLANISNVILNYILIFGKFGFPEMGIIGAAYGTLISRFIMVLFLWIKLMRNERSVKLITHLNFFKLNRKMLSRVLGLGTPSAMLMIFEVGIFTAAIWLSGMLGKNPQAANQIALNLATMTFMVFTGLSVASTIRVGNQMGRKDYKELRRIALSIFFMGGLFAIVFCVSFFLLNDILPHLYVDVKDLNDYNDTIEVIKIASTLLIAAAFFQISDSMQAMILGALKGLQDVKIPALITFVSYWLVGLPVSYFFGKKEMYASFGIWLGLLVGLTMSAILLYLRFNYLTLKLIRTNEPT